jgi:hypothetical protein
VVIVDDYWGVHPVVRSRVIIVAPITLVRKTYLVQEAWPL